MFDTVAYIGPGAGFAAAGSLLILLYALGLVVLAVLAWPFRALLWLGRRRKRDRRKASARRVIIVGLDGLDPRRTEALMEQGALPRLQELRQRGCFAPLRTTCPPMSPVAWSSFATGANPGKHGIFDFLSRNLRTYLPELSSASVTRGAGRRPRVQSRRKSRSFWSILGEHGIFSTVLRVPITFPPEEFRGLLLSGLCVPDLEGSQGNFTCFTTEPPQPGRRMSGRMITVAFDGDRAVSRIELPSPDGVESRPMVLPIEIRRPGGAGAVVLTACGQRVRVEPGQFSEWVRLTFRYGRFRRVHGICRFWLKPEDAGLTLYMSPVHIDPERPALAVSHPPFYSMYLAKLHGPFATLGLAEDTWARNEGILDDAAFLQQVYDIHEERERIFFHALDRTGEGLCACVFEAPDRVQHMFMRRGSDAADPAAAGAIDDLYVRMDRLVGRVMDRMRRGDVLFVISDHGMGHFRRGVNLNVWLRENGYLYERSGAPASDYLRGVDWSRTRAYTFGLSGVYLNLKGRESGGIVDPGEAATLKRELAERLALLRDPLDGHPAIPSIHDADAVYSGPYRNDGPDLVVGYAAGYRASWDAAVGSTAGDVFSDNDKAWSGDHCVDRDLVPGVFFCSRTMADASRAPDIMDIGPTVLGLFGIERPGYMDGTPLALARGDDTERSVLPSGTRNLMPDREARDPSLRSG